MANAAVETSQAQGLQASQRGTDAAAPQRGVRLLVFAVGPVDSVVGQSGEHRLRFQHPGARGAAADEVQMVLPETAVCSVTRPNTDDETTGESAAGRFLQKQLRHGGWANRWRTPRRG
jgi:hypothetical protein